MPRTRAWSIFVEGRLEVRQLSRLASQLEDEADQLGLTLTERERRVSPLRRSALVLLAGHTEAYVANAIQEITSGYVDAWAQLPDGGKHYISRWGYVQFVRLHDDIPEGRLAESKTRDSYLKRLRSIMEQIEGPGSRVLAGSVPGMFSPQSLDNLAKRLVGFRADGVSLYDWIKQRGHDIAQFSTVMDQFVEARNHVAHGSRPVAPSKLDLKRYMAISKLFLRDVDTYLCS